jgi:serine protease Do
VRFLRLLKYLLALALISLAGFAGAAGAIYLLLPGFSDRLPLKRPSPSPTRLEQLTPETASVVITDQDALTAAVRGIAPSVVNITDGRSAYADAPKSPTVGASGFLFDDRGYVVASQHALADFKSYRVRLADDREFVAKLIGSHRASDVTVLKIGEGEEELPAASLGDSALLQTGEWIVALGNPCAEFEPTVSVGVVSTKGRPVALKDRSYDNLIQTDAAITAANAGGPVVNLNGEVVGLCTSVYGSSPETAGAGFAVPIEDVHTVVDEMIRNGRGHRAYLGISVDDVSEEDAHLLNLRTRSGALIRGVLPGGPAAKSGLQRHDVIVSFAGQSVRSAEGLMRLARQQRLGSDLSTRFVRDGRQVTTQIRVEERD